jgi:hypothetical protein
VDNNFKSKTRIISDKIGTVAQVDTHIGTHVEQASGLKL